MGKLQREFTNNTYAPQRMNPFNFGQFIILPLLLLFNHILMGAEKDVIN